MKKYFLKQITIINSIAAHFCTLSPPTRHRYLPPPDTSTATPHRRHHRRRCLALPAREEHCAIDRSSVQCLRARHRRSRQHRRGGVAVGVSAVRCRRWRYRCRVAVIMCRNVLQWSYIVICFKKYFFHSSAVR